MTYNKTSNFCFSFYVLKNYFFDVTSKFCSRCFRCLIKSCLEVYKGS